MSDLEEFTLIGGNGVEWDLLNGPVQLRQEGLRGLHFPPQVVYSNESPARPGRVRTGRRTLARPVLLPVDIGSDLGAVEFRSVDDAFWDSIQPGQVCKIRVRVGGDTRFLTVEIDPDELEFETDPFEEFDGTVLGYPALIEMTADAPYWVGAAVEYVFQTSADSFATFPAANDDYVYYLSPSNTLGATTLANPGDEPAYPTHTIEGPADNFSITLAGGTVAGGSIPSGEAIIVTTDPLVRTARRRSDGALVTRDLASADFRPVPPGASVPATVVLIGQGRIITRFDPQYKRAWSLT